MADDLERLLDRYSAGADTSRLDDAARIRQRGRRRSLLAVATVATVVGAVTVGAAMAATRPVAVPLGGAPSSSPSAAGGCPSLDDVTQRVAVRWVDFLHAYGQSYSAAAGPGSTDPPALGAVQFVVKCSFAELNNRMGKMPPAFRDGDAAFLPAGTPVYSLTGWSPSCGLAAEHDGRWHIYSGDFVDCPNLPTAVPTSSTAAPFAPAPSSPVTDVPVTVTLGHCGVNDLHSNGMRWVAIHPPFDATNAPSAFTGHGTVSMVGATLLYTDAGGATITFDHDESYQAPICH